MYVSFTDSVMREMEWVTHQCTVNRSYSQGKSVRVTESWPCYTFKIFQN